MARKSVKQIKKDENKILTALKQNARGSIEDIAKKYRFSRQKVWRIIKRLEETKKIWGYYTVVDDEKLDRRRYIILIKRSTEPIDDAIHLARGCLKGSNLSSERFMQLKQEEKELER